MASEIASPVGHEYSGGAVEWFINVIGAILALVATGTKGFELVAFLCWGVTVLVFVGLRRPRVDQKGQGPYELDTAAGPRVPKARVASAGLSISADA
jgi:hypothetical protein